LVLILPSILRRHLSHLVLRRLDKEIDAGPVTSIYMVTAAASLSQERRHQGHHHRSQIQSELLDRTDILVLAQWRTPDESKVQVTSTTHIRVLGRVVELEHRGILPRVPEWLPIGDKTPALMD
jgi:hypothetical protein